MANLKFIKKIVNDNVVNSFNLMLNVLFGGKAPEIYDETKIYNKGECVLVLENGKYVVKTVIKDGVTGPYDPENFGDIIFTELFKDSSILTQNNVMIQTRNEALSDDLASLVYELAGLVDNRLSLKVLYRENFKNSDQLKITTGIHTPGSIQAIPGKGIDFKLLNPVELAIIPNRFKIKHFIEIQGVTTLGCSVTFNALDDTPMWFDANNALLSADFFDIPEFKKDKDKPYALDIRIHGACSNGCSIKISDLMVVYI